MKKAVKWVLIIGGSLCVAILLVLILVPAFVDIAKYKPEIEKKVAQATGRSFSVGDDLSLTLFPWAGVALADLKLGNPPGFTTPNFLSIDTFEVRIKLLPLLTSFGKNIQVSRFVIDAPKIILEKKKNGKTNWENIGGATAPKSQPKATPKSTPESQGFSLESLVVGEFAITNGNLLWVDHSSDQKQEISNLDIKLKEVSLDKPIKIELATQMNAKPLQLKGRIGPLGKKVGEGTIPFDLAIDALQTLDLKITGQVSDPAKTPRFDLSIDISEFSPRKLLSELGQAFPVQTTDPKALSRLMFNAQLNGSTKKLVVKNAELTLDDTHIQLSATAKDFAKPDLAFKLNLDQIDLDRYLPPKSENEPSKAAKTSTARKATDYGPLRRLILDGTVNINKAIIQKAKVENLHLKISARNGILKMDPVKMRLYQGDLALKTVMDVRQNTPKNNVALQANNIQVGPLLKDVLEKDLMEGTFNANAAIGMIGEAPEQIKRTLNGNGNLSFTDGAILGIDLAGMVRNVASAFGLSESPAQKPRTDFAELNIPFRIINGIFKTPKSNMASPLLRILAIGQADLVKETLDFRVEPKFVATLVGQGDQAQRSGLMVPVIVSGTFASPSFRPDMEALVKKRVDKEIQKVIEKNEGLKNLLPGKGKSGEEASPIGETFKGLMKELPFGKKK